MQRNYRPLREEISEIPRALTPGEQEKWLQTAARHPRWQLVYWYSLLAFDTCMGTNEIRTLQLRHVNLNGRTVTVSREGAKNKHRHRTIEIVDDRVLFALENLMRRAAELGATEPHHYLFPFKHHGSKTAFPGRPMTESGLKKPWQEVREASCLKSFRMYDTRHTAITRLAEAGVSLQLIMKRAGHISPQMTDHYTHLSAGFEIAEMKRARNIYTEQLRHGASRGHAYGGSLMQQPFFVPANPPAPQTMVAFSPEDLRALADAIERQRSAAHPVAV